MPESLLDNLAFIEDLARFADKLISKDEVRKKYKLPDDVWQGLANDEELVAAIEAEKVRRIRNGTTAREKAQQLFATAPDVLGNILNDPAMPVRGRIESAKELRVIAANTGPENAPASDEKFTISIILSADEKLVVDKRFGKVDPHAVKTIEHVDDNDDDHDDADTAPEHLPAITAKKDGSGGSGGEAW